MTYFAPCFNCAVDKLTCPRRASMRSAIKGLGLTSIKFKCHDRQSKFHRGQRVSFDWRYYDEGCYGEGYTATFNGTIMREKPGNKRFSIRVDQGGEYYDLKPSEVLKSPEFTSVRPDDILALDEPDKSMCKLCSAYCDDEADIARLCYETNECINPSKDCHRAANKGDG